MKRPTKDTYFLRMAALAAERATCLRRQVGCVLVDGRGHVLATGYNGRPSGFPHCNRVQKKTFTSDQDATHFANQCAFHRVRHTHDHADLRGGCRPADDCDPAVYFWPDACAGSGAKSGEGLEACEAIHAEQNALLQCPDVYAVQTAYVTVAPCTHCVKMLLNTGCRRIVFREPYAHDDHARDLWERGGRAWLHQPADGLEE